jgi:hypothetical protein
VRGLKEEELEALRMVGGPHAPIPEDIGDDVLDVLTARGLLRTWTSPTTVFWAITSMGRLILSVHVAPPL